MNKGNGVTQTLAGRRGYH